MEVSEFKKIIWDYSRKIAESVNSSFGPVTEKYGLTMLQTRILMELHQSGSHTVGSLAQSICVAGTNISAMCKKLEGQDLLERVRNREDERVVRVALTKLGQETVNEIDKTFNEKISQCLLNEAEETFNDIIAGLMKLDMLLQKINGAENAEL